MLSCFAAGHRWLPFLRETSSHPPLPCDATSGRSTSSRAVCNRPAWADRTYHPALVSRRQCGKLTGILAHFPDLGDSARRAGEDDGLGFTFGREAGTPHHNIVRIFAI